MFSWKRRQPKTPEHVLLKLEHDLARETDETIETLTRLCMVPQHVADLGPAMTLMSSVRAAVHECIHQPDPDQVSKLLAELDLKVRQHLCGDAGNNCYPRQTLAGMVDCLAQASAALGEMVDKARTRPSPSSSVHEVIVPVDLLYQAHACLFPAERMVVVGGQGGHFTRLGALFDVTGDSQTTLVKNHPRRLAQALIVFQKAGSRMAAWGHSHPGLGPGATHPSHTDLNQHADWIRTYTPNLVSFIVVEDGFIRFFGTALDHKRIALTLTGSGITPENPHEHIYRIDV